MPLSGLNPVSDPWSNIATALQSFQNGTIQPGTIQMLVDSLCHLNLGGIAIHLVSGLNATGEYAALKDQWIAQARQAQSGKVAWASRKRRFAANITALAGISPDLASLTAFWEGAQNRYELYLAADGNVLVYDTQGGSPFNAVLGGLRNHLAESQQWNYQKNGPQFIMPVAFNGAGYGWLLTRILETTAKSFLNYSAAVYIVEPDPAAICVLLHVQDLRFATDRLRFFVGQDAADRFGQALGNNTTWSLPGVFASSQLTLRPAPPLEKIRETINAERQEHLEKLKREAAAYYDALPVTHWQQRFADAQAGKAKLTMLGLTTRYSTVLQYSMYELGEAIRAVGHEFVLAIESDDQSLERSDLELIVRHKPDLIVQISRMRYENPWLPKRVPFLCWDQDNLPCLRTPEATASLDDMTYVAGPGANIGFSRLGWPRRNCLFVLPAGQWHRYAGQTPDPALLQQHDADFAYISNASVRPEEMYADARKNVAKDPVVLAALDQAAHEILTRSAEGGLWNLPAIHQLISQVLPGLHAGSPQYQDIEFALQHLADRTFRHVTLQWVADYCRDAGRTLRLYGNGWEKTPGLSQHAAGPAKPGEQVLAIYRATRINLQIIESGMLHSRLLDGIAAGGFFMSRLSLLDYQNSPTDRAISCLVDKVQEHGITTLDQLKALPDAEVQRNLPVVLDHFKHDVTGDDLIKTLVILDSYRMVRQITPTLMEIGFGNRNDFVRLADRYLTDDAYRQRMVETIHLMMRDHFSYDARLKQFLAGIQSGMRVSS